MGQSQRKCGYNTDKPRNGNIGDVPRDRTKYILYDLYGTLAIS